MGDRATPGSPLLVGGLLIWIATPAAILGLAIQVVRMAIDDEPSGFLGGLALAYTIYLAFGIRIFWSRSTIVVPTTLLIGAGLWTLAFQVVEDTLGPPAIGALFLVPFATIFLVRLTFRGSWGLEPPSETPSRLETVEALLRRGRGFGARSSPLD